MIGISVFLCGAVVIPLIWAYTGVTGWQASAIRSTVMMTVIIAGWSLKRPSDLLNSLVAAGFIILVWEPQQIFQARFQLSFFHMSEDQKYFSQALVSNHYLSFPAIKLR